MLLDRRGARFLMRRLVAKTGSDGVCVLHRKRAPPQFRRGVLQPAEARRLAMSEPLT